MRIAGYPSSTPWGKPSRRGAMSRRYDRMVWDPGEARWYAVAGDVPGCVFVLDAGTRELYRLRPRLGRCGEPILDLWWDGEDRLLWLVTGEGIGRLNTAGDFLGPWMTPPVGTEYRALCVLGRYVYVALNKERCAYLASYLKSSGAFLEQVCLGGEYNSAVEILSRRVVNTPKVTGYALPDGAYVPGEEISNAEGTRLTGKKLIIEGVIRQKVIYTALAADQALHAASFQIPFSVFVIVEGDQPLSQDFLVYPYLEDVFLCRLSPRSAFSNNTLFIKAVPVC